MSSWYKKKLIQSSPGFPQNYPNGVNCVYRIVAGAGLDVILTFTALDIEADAQCRWDSLAINFQLSGQSNTVCGNLVSPNGFTANPLTGVGPVSLTMTADDGVNGGGFQINYEIINPDPCIGGWQIIKVTRKLKSQIFHPRLKRNHVEKTDRVNQLKTIMVTFAIAIPDGVEMHAMKMLTNVLMEHTAVLMVASVLMKKESFTIK